jgi:HK97 family phage prohead protease
MNRAYSLLDVKSVHDAERVIEGIASTPSPDRMGDVVEPLGAKFALPMPLLWQHDHESPIGHVEFAKPTKTGIPFKARFAHPDDFDSETLKERLRLAWDSVKGGLVRAVSIGFKPLEYSFMDGGGVRFAAWEWLELSAVTVPANAEATINVIRSIDAEFRKAAGVDTQASEPEAAASGQDASEAPDRSGRVVRLQAPARARAPFVINRIVHTR